MSYNSRKVKEIIAAVSGCMPDDLETDTTLESLGIDHLELLDLEFELADEFGIRLPDDASESFITVGAVVRCIDDIVNVYGE